MNLFKKTVCVVLMLTVVLGLTACASKLTHKNMVSFLEDQKYDDYDDPEDYFAIYGRIAGGMTRDEGAYITCTKRDAQDIYDVVFNRFNTYPTYDVTEATTFAYNDKDGLYIGFLFTFEDAKKAGKLYKKYSREHADDGESGEKNGITYTIECGETSKKRHSICGVYQKDDVVMIIRGLSADKDFSDDFCKAFGVISPTTAED